MSTLAASHLRKTLGRRRVPALDDLSFTTTTRRVAVLGPNGAGKTTLFRVLATLADPDGGSFSVADQEVATPGEVEAYRRSLGVLPQSFSALGSYSCAEFLEYVCWLKKVPRPAVAENVDQALRTVDLEDRRDARVRTLSGGMRRRLGLAQTTLGDPDVILMDEPTAGLDPEQRDRFAGVFERASETALVVFTTHISADVVNLAEEVVVLFEGRLRFVGTVGELAACGGGPARDVSSESVDAGYIAVLRGEGHVDRGGA
ncbi:ABC-2 type transport system ATP-binding protein [Nocardioides zeae]|uniref:ABC-2 type transport system ATP-binding protein n=1 Tax=Nocardioides zeae TaxID=1457234 RepID=A0ACC6ICH8_9ACTN|nr:ATP-binding cassette domain-containing protein [Nocardioides zeae]MDR6175496.1 ABC-2 type transport system ATP-binding protein [Nocardioides zeae]MDR6208427.1 ABC-2 type transport system ATP-binding protein [Nocardioides zeae]